MNGRLKFGFGRIYRGFWVSLKKRLHGRAVQDTIQAHFKGTWTSS